MGDIAIQLLKKREEFKEVEFEESAKTPVEILMENIKDIIEETENTKKDDVISDVTTDGVTLNAPVKFEEKSDERGNVIYQLHTEKD